MRRTSVMLASRSIGPSGRAASPTAPSVSSVMTRSGRSGGRDRRAGGDSVASSAMGGLRSKVGLDLVGEQEIVDAAMQRLELGAPDRLEAEMMGVELGLDAAGMRREHQDAAADQQRLLDRMGDEDHREADLLPQSDQLLLHLAAGERVERRERLVHQQHLW